MYASIMDEAIRKTLGEKFYYFDNHQFGISWLSTGDNGLRK